jgi:hypothetical protein
MSFQFTFVSGVPCTSFVFGEQPDIEIQFTFVSGVPCTRQSRARHPPGQVAQFQFTFVSGVPCTADFGVHATS